jgi:iron(III) transport system ATP-binding protein
MDYLVASNISKSFNGSAAVADATVAVNQGESLALLGPSGCGKTTLLRILAGLEVPDSGTVSIAKTLLAGPHVFVPAEARRIGMVFQDWALFPHMTVAGNVAYGLTRSEIARGRVGEMLAMVGLSGLGDRYPEQLSGGQAQRVALARALAPQPRIVLFDEPFSNLDGELRSRLRSDVVALLRDLGMTSIFVTHDQEEAFVLGDRVAIMSDGRIVQHGTPAEVYQYPATPWVAGFVGEANVLEGHAGNGTMTSPLGSLPLLDGVAGTCRAVVRPEHLVLSEGGDGVVAGVQFYGHDSSYEVSVAGTRVVVRGMAAPRFGPGDKVAVTYVGPEVVAFPVD